MKRLVILIVFFVVSSLLIPLAVFFFTNRAENSPSQSNLSDETICVYFHDRDEVKEMNIEEYLCGVVAAEMPASFETEALKAQAVAARSYAEYRRINPATDHPDADVCTDFAHCKAYKSEAQLEELWGKNADENFKRIHTAVYETSGEILTYNGEVALAVFHSQSSGGRTENSADVWGGNIPYLVSVETHGEENAPNFYSSVSVSFEEFKQRLIENFSDIKINTPGDIGSPVLSEGGNVKSIVIGGTEISGKEMRSIFNLRSSCFKITANDRSVTFEVAGYGHGVGMSQYGANTLAKEGYSYIQILTHYYSGTQIEGV